MLGLPVRCAPFLPNTPLFSLLLVLLLRRLHFDLLRMVLRVLILLLPVGVGLLLLLLLLRCCCCCLSA